MDIKELIEKAVQLLKDARYTNSRIYTYRWLWSKGIIPFMESRGLDDYNENVGKEFMLTCHNEGELSFHHRDLVKSADVLTNALLRNVVISRINFQNPYPLVICKYIFGVFRKNWCSLYLSFEFRNQAV